MKTVTISKDDFDWLCRKSRSGGLTYGEARNLESIQRTYSPSVPPSRRNTEHMEAGTISVPVEDLHLVVDMAEECPSGYGSNYHDALERVKSLLESSDEC